MSIVFRCILILQLVMCVSSFLISQEVIRIDDFNDDQLSPDWKFRHDGGDTLYTISPDTLSNVLDANTFDSDNFIIKKIKVDIVQYPYLNWKWKAISMPVDGDESKKKYCDVVASINVVLRARKWAPKTIKYSWSTTLEAGTLTKSPFAFWPSRADIVVQRGVGKPTHEWIEEKVNVLEEYKRLYKKKKVKSYVVEAIVIMSDSDNTKSPSHARYDDIFFSKE